MKFILTMIPLIAFALLSLACSKPDMRVKPDAYKVSGRMPVNDDGADAVSSQKVVAAGNDNSEIVTERDRMGGYIETRTFKDNALIDRVVVRKLIDGTRVGIIYGKNGEKKTLEDKHIALAMLADGVELATSAGITATSEALSSPTTVVGNSIPTTAGPSPALSSSNSMPITQDRRPADPPVIRQDSIDREAKAARQAEEVELKRLTEKNRVRELQREIRGLTTPPVR